MKKRSEKKRISAVRVKHFLPAFFAACLLLLSYSAGAQKKWSFECKPGLNFASKQLGNTKLKTGFGFETVLAYKFVPQLAAYAGWSWNRFPSNETVKEQKRDFEETGYNFGLQFIHPIENTMIGYMVKAGGTYNHIETENNDGIILHDSGHGWGWQVGVGLPVRLAQRWQLLPEIRYRSLARDVNMGDGLIPVTLNYVSAAVGLSISF